jgi:acetolactate synthase I/II/III large subunit
VRWAQEQQGCAILDFRIDPEANVYPMIPSGMSVHEMIEEDGV